MNWDTLLYSYGPALVVVAIILIFTRKTRQRYLAANARAIELAEQNQVILREMLETLKAIRDKK